LQASGGSRYVDTAASHSGESSAEISDGCSDVSELIASDDEDEGCGENFSNYRAADYEMRHDRRTKKANNVEKKKKANIKAGGVKRTRKGKTKKTNTGAASARKKGHREVQDTEASGDEVAGGYGNIGKTSCYLRGGAKHAEMMIKKQSEHAQQMRLNAGFSLQVLRETMLRERCPLISPELIFEIPVDVYPAYLNTKPGLREKICASTKTMQLVLDSNRVFPLSDATMSLALVFKMPSERHPKELTEAIHFFQLMQAMPGDAKFALQTPSVRYVDVQISRRTVTFKGLAREMGGASRDADDYCQESLASGFACRTVGSLALHGCTSETLKPIPLVDLFLTYHGATVRSLVTVEGEERSVEDRVMFCVLHVVAAPGVSLHNLVVELLNPTASMARNNKELERKHRNEAWCKLGRIQSGYLAGIGEGSRGNGEFGPSALVSPARNSHFYQVFSEFTVGLRMDRIIDGHVRMRQSQLGGSDFRVASVEMINFPRLDENRLELLERMHIAHMEMVAVFEDTFNDCLLDFEMKSPDEKRYSLFDLPPLLMNPIESGERDGVLQVVKWGLAYSRMIVEIRWTNSASSYPTLAEMNACMDAPKLIEVTLMNYLYSRGVAHNFEPDVLIDATQASTVATDSSVESLTMSEKLELHGFGYHGCNAKWLKQIMIKLRRESTAAGSLGSVFAQYERFVKAVFMAHVSQVEAGYWNSVYIKDTNSFIAGFQSETVRRVNEALRQLVPGVGRGYVDCIDAALAQSVAVMDRANRRYLFLVAGNLQVCDIGVTSLN
jgi:hypothetical protein